MSAFGTKLTLPRMLPNIRFQGQADNVSGDRRCPLLIPSGLSDQAFYCNAREPDSTDCASGNFQVPFKISARGR